MNKTMGNRPLKTAVPQFRQVWQPLHQGINAQMPLHAQEVQLGFVQVKTKQVQRGRQQKQGEEPDLPKACAGSV